MGIAPHLQEKFAYLKIEECGRVGRPKQPIGLAHFLDLVSNQQSWAFNVMTGAKTGQEFGQKRLFGQPSGRGGVSVGCTAERFITKTTFPEIGEDIKVTWFHQGDT